jgi:hypothetical protein
MESIQSENQIEESKKLTATEARATFENRKHLILEHILNQVSIKVGSPFPSNTLDITEYFLTPKSLGKTGMWIIEELKSLGYEVEFSKWYQKPNITIIW